MRTNKKTQVLVVGAGPVGLTAAISLQQRGIDFEILDKTSGPSEHSKACLLSPETLAFFDDMGLLKSVLDRALAIKGIQLFKGTDCTAVFDLSTLPSAFPFIVSIPQGELEDVLVSCLKASKKKILWNHRVARINRSAGGVLVTIDKLGRHMTGYAVMHEEMLVDRTFGLEANVALIKFLMKQWAIRWDHWSSNAREIKMMIQCSPSVFPTWVLPATFLYRTTDLVMDSR